MITQFAAAGIDGRQIENIGDEIEQMRRAGVDVTGVAAVLLIADGTEELHPQDLGKPYDRVERRA